MPGREGGQALTRGGARSSRQAVVDGVARCGPLHRIAVLRNSAATSHPSTGDLAGRQVSLVRPPELDFDLTLGDSSSLPMEPALKSWIKQ